MTTYSYVVMGVSGSGKTSVGWRLSQATGAKFIDGDDLHPRNNIDKMVRGIPLDDGDRAPWLERLNDALYSLSQKNERGFIVCSALKKCYRDRLRRGNPALRFLWLSGSHQKILAHMQQRGGHFMPPELLESQFRTLEAPDEREEDVLEIAIDGDLEQVVQRCLTLIEQ